jgi:hypothetical protein
MHLFGSVFRAHCSVLLHFLKAQQSVTVEVGVLETFIALLFYFLAAYLPVTIPIQRFELNRSATILGCCVDRRRSERKCTKRKPALENESFHEFLLL